MKTPSRTKRFGRALLSAALLGSTVVAQSASRPQPTAVINVSLDPSGESEELWSVLLREGRIERLLPAGDPVPHGMRRIDAGGALLLPAFLDAYTRTGCETPKPVKDQDLPVDETSDVRIDMRLANRKGVQPSFRAVEALAFEDDARSAWHEAGFGLALVSPGGELLSGSSAFVTVREAAPRDLVLAPEVFTHAAFAASGPGYPSTLMGYTAQMRQFLIDAQWQRERSQRYVDGRPGLRPPFDEELAAGTALLGGGRRLACAAQGARDMERWMRIAREFDLRLVITGGREAWRLGEELAAADIPVLLTLDWGEEVDDPLEETEKEQDEPPEDSGEGEERGEGSSEDAADEPRGAQVEEQPEEQAEEAEDPSDEAIWEYEEPLAVRLERRRLWEEDRDNALRLDELGVRFAFGTDSAAPDGLLEKVRTLVEQGLPVESAREALTTRAAEILGVADRVGRVEAGYDATFCLWTADPLVDEKASVAWVFVDGFATELEVKEERLEGEPDEGVDLSGEWTLSFQGEAGALEAHLVLEMDKSGEVQGSFEMDNPFGEGTWSSDVEGKVAGDQVQLEVEIVVEQFKIPIDVKGTVEGDEIKGKLISRPSWSEESETRSFRGKRKNPETLGSMANGFERSSKR